jgi:hypothetical protein
MEDFGHHYEVATSDLLCFFSSFRNQRMQSRARVYIPSNILPGPNLSNLVKDFFDGASSPPWRHY